MELYLDRFSYSKEDTEGVLLLPEHEVHTMECPWIPGSHAGGKPFKSCIPDGEYEMIPWTRPRGDEVFMLVNHDLGVYGSKDEWEKNGRVGRYLILFHIANFVSDVVGCVAPGMHRSCLRNNRTGRLERAVSNSGDTMRLLNDVLGREQTHRLFIRPKYGTGEIA